MVCAGGGGFLMQGLGRHLGPHQRLLALDDGADVWNTHHHAGDLPRTRAEHSTNRPEVQAGLSFVTPEDTEVGRIAV